MEIHTLEYTVGAVVVALYSIERINTPAIKPETTTPQRYWSMVLAYAAASVLLYFALSISLGAAGIEVLRKLEFIPKSVNANSPPVLMALLLTVLLAKIPGLSRLDEAVRRSFHRRASMSSIAGNISYLLQRSPLRLSPERQTEITAYLKGQGIGEKDIVFVNNQSAQYVWTRTAVLLYSLREWKSAPDYANFVAAYREEWETLIEDGEKYEAKAVRCFRLSVAEASAPGVDEPLSSALKDCRRHYAEQLNALLLQLSDFMGRGLAVACGNNPERRRLALVEIGLDVQADVGYTTHQIAFVMMVALGGSVLFPLVIQLLGNGEHKVNQYVFKVAAGYTIAALLALSYHKRRGGQLCRSAAERPWGQYLLVGVAAAALTVAFGLVFDLLTRRDPIATLTRLWQWNFVYLLRPLVFGALMAYLIDTAVARERRRARQWTETAVVAAAMAITSLAIWLLLESILTAHPEYKYKLPNIETMILSAAALGAILGYWLPNSTRHIAERVPEPPEQQVAGSPAGTVAS